MFIVRKECEKEGTTFIGPFLREEHATSYIERVSGENMRVCPMKTPDLESVGEALEYIHSSDMKEAKPAKRSSGMFFGKFTTGDADAT